MLTFSLELEIFRVAVERIHQNSEKWRLCQDLLSKKDFEAVLATYVFMTMAPTLLRQFRRLLQIKKIITNAFRMLYNSLNS